GRRGARAVRRRDRVPVPGPHHPSRPGGDDRGRTRSAGPAVRARRARGAARGSARGRGVIGRVVGGLGGSAIRIAQEVGGIVVLTAQVLRALIPPRIDGRELLKNLHKMGNRSVPIIALTAFFAGALMVLQAGPFVKKFG